MFFDTSLDPPFTIYFRGPPLHFFVAEPKKRVGNLREFLFDIDLFWVSLDSEERLAYSLHATIWSRLAPFSENKEGQRMARDATLFYQDANHARSSYHSRKPYSVPLSPDAI